MWGQRDNRGVKPPLSITQVSDAERTMVKQIAYGLCYGMGSGRMAAALGVSELKAREMADDFKGSHPSLTGWMQVRLHKTGAGRLQGGCSLGDGRLSVLFLKLSMARS
jgi:hypothetical protein